MALGINSRLRLANERLLPGHLMHPPEVFVFGLNTFCNLHCRMCDVGTGHSDTNFGANLVGAKNRVMSLDLCKRAMDQIAAWSPGAVVAFVYTEPLAWPPIASAVAHATKLGLRPQVTTNGLLLPRHAAALVEAGCAELVVSIDGPRQVHDFIRRKDGSFDRALEGIGMVRTLDPDMPIIVVAAVTEWNTGQMAQLARDLSGSGITRLLVIHNQFVAEGVARMHNDRFPLLTATASNIFESDVTAIDLEALSQDLEHMKRAAHPFALAIVPDITDIAALKTYYHDPARYVGTTCKDPFRIMMIDADGEVIPAHGRCFRFPVGNIDDQSLKDLWNAKPLRDLRRTLVKAGGLLPACSRCCGGVT